MSDYARRMYAEALTRLNDADVLAESMRTQSDSQQLLRILAFEVLLKCAVRLCDQTAKASHNYNNLWLALPGHARKQILLTAQERMPGHANFSDLERLLKAYQFVFEKARYYYELNEGNTLRQQRARGLRWRRRGAPEDEADLRYYPNELDCLIVGLRAFIEARLAGAAAP